MTSLPRSSAKQSNSAAKPSDEASEGSIVQYEDDSHPLLGVVTGFRKDKLLVVNIRGREVELTRNRLHFAPGKVPANATTTKSRTDYLIELNQKVDAALAGCNLDDVWSVVVAEPRAYEVSELTTLYFGKDDLISHLIMRTALVKERTYFKRDKDQFEPRPEGTVEELRRAESIKQEKARAQQVMVEAFESRIRDASLPLPPAVFDAVTLLEELAANCSNVDAGRQKEAKDLLNLCIERFKLPPNGTAEEKAFAVLEMIGHFGRDTNLSLIRHRVPVDFPNAALDTAKSISGPGESGAVRRDLTSMFTFTVDDASTLDMDDALSVRQTEEGFELGVHITDVASLFPFDSLLDVEARRRATSIYCADRTVNMLPEALSEGTASLVAGEVRGAITCLVRCTQRFEILGWEVVPSLVRIAKRYTYDDVDRLLDEGDMTLSFLYEAAAAHEGWRIEHGANRVHKREVVPLLEADGEIRLLEIDETSPARMLVAEMMVLMNRFVAQYCADNQIPVLFRGQERPEVSADEGESNPTPDGPARDFATRTRLKKSVTSLTPLPHASLGLPSYLQCTSPIRRYMDLCHQRQLLSFMGTGKPWLPAAEFEELAREVEQSLEPANLVGRETRRYWLTRYLENRGKKNPISGTVVRTDTKMPLIELDEVYMTVFARTSKKIRVGDVVELRLTHLDARNDYVRAEIIS